MDGRVEAMMFLLGAVVGFLLVVILSNFVPNEKKVREVPPCECSVEEPHFARSLSLLLSAHLLGGNRITELRNGAQTFPAMLAAIRGAEKTITFENFIYWQGKVGHEFADALIQCARRGVKVHVLLDFVGTSRMKRAAIKALRDAGCQIVIFHAPTWYHLARFNNRTHRKLLIVDGKVGFTGGVGIGDEWQGDAEDENHWRDTHFKIEGPVVGQMQALFMVNWIRAHATCEHSPDYFPELPAVGDQHAHMFNSSPEDGSENARLMFLHSFSAARSHVLLQQAYFVPDKRVIEELVKTRKRGVRVEIMVPGHRIDTPLVRRASRALWGPLLEAGVKLWEFEPTNLHCKIMTVDGCWSSVGSTNFDFRAFRWNDEANLNVHDRSFAQRLEQTFENDRKRCTQITFESWRSRPWTTKLADQACALFRFQM